MYKIIGLTGGIASGKTTVSNYLKDRGYTVLDADQYSRQTTAKNGPALPQIIEVFQKTSLTMQGTRPWRLGSIIATMPINAGR